jgi:translocation and assembly module TamA
MAGWERKRLHYPGHKIHLNGKVSEKRNQVNLEYSLPGDKPATDTIRLTARVIEEKFNKKHSMRSKFGTTYNMILFPNIEQILALHYLSEVDRILPTAPKTRTHFLIPSIGYVWSDMKKSTSLLPYGTRIGITVRGGLGSLLSTTNLIQTDCRIKCIYPLGNFTRLILRNDLGVISAGDRDDIPLSLRYFTGGDQTIRGYGYRSLGPVKDDANGEPIVVGGKYLFVVSAEIDRVIYRNISLAAFVDTGNAMNKLSARLATGVGIGLRWGTPLGPLRFDVAQGLNNKKFNPRVHVTFGMDF